MKLKYRPPQPGKDGTGMADVKGQRPCSAPLLAQSALEEEASAGRPQAQRRGYALMAPPAACGSTCSPPAPPCFSAQERLAKKRDRVKKVKNTVQHRGARMLQTG